MLPIAKHMERNEWIRLPINKMDFASKMKPKSSNFISFIVPLDFLKKKKPCANEKERSYSPGALTPAFSKVNK